MAQVVSFFSITPRIIVTVILCVKGVLELQEGQDVDQNTEMAIQYFLDRFYMSR